VSGIVCTSLLSALLSALCPSTPLAVTSRCCSDQLPLHLPLAIPSAANPASLPRLPSLALFRSPPTRQLQHAPVLPFIRPPPTTHPHLDSSTVLTCRSTSHTLLSPIQTSTFLQPHFFHSPSFAGQAVSIVSCPRPTLPFCPFLPQHHSRLLG
jgi:hypothetical protein